MKKFSSTLFLFVLFLFHSCSEKNEECIRICTNEYRTITVSIEDEEGKPVALDDYKVVHFKSARDLTLEVDEETFNLMRQAGSYPIFSDKYAQEFMQQQLEIRFKGFIKGREVVNEVYKVGADCCHVVHISGDLELVL